MTSQAIWIIVIFYFFLSTSWDQLVSACCNSHQKKKTTKTRDASHLNQPCKLSLLGAYQFQPIHAYAHAAECSYRCYLHVNSLSSNINKMLFISHKQLRSVPFPRFYHAATFDSMFGWQKPKAKLESTKYMLLWLIDWTKSKTRGDYLLKRCQIGTKRAIAVLILSLHYCKPIHLGVEKTGEWREMTIKINIG